ncbi:MAG: SpoIIE family protein phosphatase [Planctomycetes bacterium]|nr:SpoIIE family protein phosphatase [Planctomycetota bacterium]
MKVQLLIENGELTGKVIYVTEGQSITIGRTFQNQVALSDPGCSRVHCKLANDGRMCTVEDMKSRNGTLLNGERLAGPQVLKDGDRVTVGSTVFRITTGLNTQIMHKEPATTLPFELKRTPPQRETLAELVSDFAGVSVPGTQTHIPAAMPTVVCSSCQASIPEEDLSAGRACIVAGAPRCAKCMGAEARTQIGQYRLLQRIAEGSTGKVYKAEHMHMGKIVAVKTLHARLTQKSSVVLRFLREARAGAAINHQNVIQMFDAGEDGGVYYLVMEYVDGASVAEHVRQHGPLATSLALKVLIQVASALDYAHQKKILHRDLRPANILFGRDGTVKLIDLGTAKWIEESGMGTMTQSGSLFSDFNYAAPELMMGGSIDSHVDLYSLGASAYFMLAGEPPFKVNTLKDLLNAFQAGALRPLQDFNSTVPDALSFLIGRLLARDPKQRPSGAAEVVSELRTLYSQLYGGSVSTGPGDAVEEMLTPDARALQHDMRLAKDVQQKLLPDELPSIPGCDLAKFYKPVSAVGGDYFDVFPVAGNKFAMIIGDVSGKGISGAMVMVMVRSVFHMLDARQISPKAAIEAANRVLSRDIKRGMFVSLIYMLYDPSDSSVMIGNAGHNPPLLYRERTKEAEFIRLKGMAMGITAGEKFGQNSEETRLALEPGDRLLLYTDGIVEAENLERKQFGEESLVEVFSRVAAGGPGGIVKAVVDAVDAFRGSAAQSDDVTIIALATQPRT